jgi:hypothetical protein
VGESYGRGYPVRVLLDAVPKMKYAEQRIATRWPAAHAMTLAVAC